MHCAEGETGTFTWKDKREYVGAFKNNKMEGKGKFIWPQTDTGSSYWSKSV